MAVLKWRLGPATLVTAAFIGPGTVVTASMAGAQYGYALLWALVFSVLAIIVLQEMAARLGVVTQQGLGENLRQLSVVPWLRGSLSLLVLAAIVVGNSAYQAGNITGASLGMDALFSGTDWLGNLQQNGVNIWALFIGAMAALVLWHGRYRLIERCLIALVILMSFSFVLAMILSQPDWQEMLKGMAWPQIPDGAVLTVVALIGTTVVPYSLFLHAASAAKNWPSSKVAVHEAIRDARTDIAISLPLGGLISIAIVTTAASAYFGRPEQLQNIGQLAQGLTPLFGQAATWCMALGLMAAGLSSAITAPLAAAYALCGILGRPLSLNQPLFRITWLVIIVMGVLLSSLGIRPVALIWFAQVANGILLPVITVALLLAMNQLPAGYRNNIYQNLAGIAVLLVTLLLSGRSLAMAFALL